MKSIQAAAAALFLTLALVTTVAASDHKVTICHATSSETNPYVEITVSENAVYGPGGHFNENGTTQAGHEQDYFGPCNVESTPTPTPEPTSTPTPEPTPTPEATPTPEPTPTPTPDATPTPTPDATPDATPTPDVPNATPPATDTLSTSQPSNFTAVAFLAMFFATAFASVLLAKRR